MPINVYVVQAHDSIVSERNEQAFSNHGWASRRLELSLEVYETKGREDEDLPTREGFWPVSAEKTANDVILLLLPIGWGTPFLASLPPLLECEGAYISNDSERVDCMIR